MCPISKRVVLSKRKPLALQKEHTPKQQKPKLPPLKPRLTPSPNFHHSNSWHLLLPSLPPAPLRPLSSPPHQTQLQSTPPPNRSQTLQTTKPRPVRVRGRPPGAGVEPDQLALVNRVHPTPIPPLQYVTPRNGNRVQRSVWRWEEIGICRSQSVDTHLVVGTSLILKCPLYYNGIVVA